MAGKLLVLVAGDDLTVGGCATLLIAGPLPPHDEVPATARLGRVAAGFFSANCCRRTLFMYCRACSEAWEFGQDSNSDGKKDQKSGSA